ncbi:MAG: 16S rRNA (guanine(527)-N(7))-methyltransferase RsmG [Novosphingobium sp.]|nr:16S rRNA (guanine(527)-N(7))-methyltransferase RsmG [Novosphingobium sp.]
MIASEEAAIAFVRGLPECDDAALDRLTTLVRCLAEENERQNLVSVASLDVVWQRHIADSAQLLRHVPRETGPWLDLGSGAGFPGLVVAALRPECAVYLAESRALRCAWLRDMANRLALSCVTVLEGPVEKAPDILKAAVISARAFAPLGRLLELSARFSTSETAWLLPKGRSARDELKKLRGWKHAFHVEQSLTDPDAGIIVGTLAGGKGKSR